MDDFVKQCDATVWVSYDDAYYNIPENELPEWETISYIRDNIFDVTQI